MFFIFQEGYGKRIDNEEYTYGMPIKDAEKCFLMDVEIGKFH